MSAPDIPPLNLSGSGARLEGEFIRTLAYPDPWLFCSVDGSNVIGGGIISMPFSPSVEIGFANGGPNDIGGNVVVGVCWGVSRLMSFSSYG